MMRVSGTLIPIAKYPAFTAEETEAILKSIVPAERWELFMKDQAIDLSYAHGTEARFRVNGYRVQGAVALALRLIPHAVRTFTELNLPSTLEVFTQREQGFFLVVGPVGQGKSTTLAAMIERINESRSEHILTIEDPVEYIFTPKKSLIHQREVHIDTPDFKDALQGSFREDVDVIMVGEMRDYETISSAVTAAETGHLVFSTLHTNDAASAIARLLDMGVESFLLSSTIRGILAQRLVRIICPRCKEIISSPGNGGGQIPAAEGGLPVFAGRGCEHCAHTGYHGRMGIFELISIDDPIRKLIVDRAAVNDIEEAARMNGMKTLFEDGLEKVKTGITTIAELLRVTQEA